jgi:hypothetical protein
MAIDAVLVGTRGTGSANTATTTAGTTTASGSTFVAAVSWGVAASSPVVTDSKGNTYTAIGTPQADSWGGYAQLFACENGTGGSSHTATFTTTGDSFPTIHLIEITGAETASLDQIAQTQDSSSPFSVTSPTLSQADEVVISICANQDGGGASYASSNFTVLSQEIDTNNFWTSAVGKLVVSATTAVTPSWTRSTGSAAVALATFKQLSGGAYTLDQYGFRWRLDDGSETTATWAAAQNAAP